MSLSVGVVVPNFRGGRFLRECIDSLLEQDYPDLQVIVMDGGSDDDSVEILESYGDRIRWVSEPDEGQSDAINKGLALLDTDLVGWLNSDDMLLPGAVRRVAEAAVADADAVLFHGDLEIVDVEGALMQVATSSDLDYEEMRAGRGKTLQPGSFYRASAVREVGGVDKAFYLLMDVDLWIRLLAHGTAKRIHGPLARFRVHQAAKSSQKPYRYYWETAMLGLRHERDRPVSALVRRGTRIGLYQAAYVLGVDRGPRRRQLNAARRVLKDIATHPVNADHPVRAVLRFAGWQTFKRVTGRPLVIHPFPGGIFRCHPDSVSVASLLYMQGSPDMAEMSFMRAYLKPGDTVLDVGANEGIYTVLAGTLVGNGGRVVSFEPDRRAGDRLLENVSLSGLRCVELRRAAVSDREGELRFSLGLDSMNHIVEAGGVTVPCERLDDVPVDEVAFAKIDVAGAEVLAFRGARARMLRGDPPVWILEINQTCQRYGFQPEDVEAELERCGYVLARFDWKTRKLERAPGAWRSSMNVLAVHERRWDGVEARLRGN